ncbi:uncharacterized protein BDV14DRAFT_201084 [Aspergillus stella-maris]|uniref:uncharacterized protein n=1 Tax=Aspergillus stella-maris TaxID=1810926 RepID=UPI003CCD1C62
MALDDLKHHSKHQAVLLTVAVKEGCCRESRKLSFIAKHCDTNDGGRDNICTRWEKFWFLHFTEEKKHMKSNSLCWQFHNEKKVHSVRLSKLFPTHKRTPVRIAEYKLNEDNIALVQLECASLPQKPSRAVVYFLARKKVLFERNFNATFLKTLLVIRK